jgi:predicted DNA-binding transcriptional regulator YafY
MATERGRGRRRPAGHITLGRAARLFRLVRLLAEGPRPRDQILAVLGIGLRTFYREVELLRRVGVRIRLLRKQYTLQTTAEQAEGRLPFPDPQLTFAEMRELVQGSGEAARRLAGLYEQVVSGVEDARSGRQRKTRKS